MPEAEVVEICQGSNGVGRNLAGEAGSRQAELDDGVVVAVDAFPGTRGRVGGVPPERPAAHGRAEQKQGCPVGGQVRFGGRDERE